MDGPASALPGVRAQRTSAGRAVKRILVCLDRSPVSEAAVPYAAAVARAFGAEITLLHATATRAGELDPADALGWEITRTETQQYLERIRTELAAEGLVATAVLTHGAPAEQILVTARDVEADLIVLSSHGERGRSPWNLGGTAEKVVSRAGVSVLVVPTGAPPESVSCDRVLLPLDGSQRAECVLPAALGLVRAYHATIGLVHVVGEPEIFRTALPSASDRALIDALVHRNHELAGRYLDTLAARLRAEGIEVLTFLERGNDAHGALSALAARESFDLVVLAAHGRSGIVTRPHGALAAQFVSDIDRPLLVVQDLSAAEHAQREKRAHVHATAPRLGGLHDDLKP